MNQWVGTAGSLTGFQATGMTTGLGATPGRETLQSRLATTNEVLANCEGLLGQISTKLNGPVPSGTDKADALPSGVNHLAMDLMSRATRLRDVLVGLSDAIA